MKKVNNEWFYIQRWKQNRLVAPDIGDTVMFDSKTSFFSESFYGKFGVITAKDQFSLHIDVTWLKPFEYRGDLTETSRLSIDHFSLYKKNIN